MVCVSKKDSAPKIKLKYDCQYYLQQSYELIFLDFWFCKAKIMLKETQFPFKKKNVL
jgi:hypothetical protein